MFVYLEHLRRATDLVAIFVSTEISQHLEWLHVESVAFRYISSTCKFQYFTFCIFNVVSNNCDSIAVKLGCSLKFELFSRGVIVKNPNLEFRFCPLVACEYEISIRRILLFLSSWQVVNLAFHVPDNSKYVTL